MTTKTLEMNGEGVFEANEDGIFTKAGRAADGFFSGIGDTVSEAWSSVGTFMDKHPAIKSVGKNVLTVVAFGAGLYLLVLGSLIIGYWVGKTLVWLFPEALVAAEVAPVAVTIV